ncbi:MAG: response regulator [Desulfarculales bacterium]|jgi:signal transduction histidine kinase/ActR/RegA family two-component response regulator|nr:response regulator [Desulfarculales bacterium]
MLGLKFKFLAPFLLGALLLTLILSVYSFTSVRSTVENNITVFSETHSKKVASDMTYLLRHMLDNLEKVTSEPKVEMLLRNQGELSSAEAEDLQQWLNLLVESNDYNRNLYIVNSAGICVAAYSMLQLGVDYSNRPYVRDALQGITSFGDMKVGSMTNNLNTAAAAPLFLNGAVQGAVVTINDFPAIVDYQEENGSGDLRALFTAFLSPEGSFMAHRDQSLIKEQGKYASLYKDLFAAARAEQQAEYDLKGRNYIGFAQIEPMSKWLVITSGVREEVLASASNIGRTVFIISILVMIIICFAVVRVANGLLSSLLSLIEYAHTVAHGDLQRDLPPSRRRDELGELHNSLQTLVSSLRRMVEKSQEASTMKSQFMANMSHEILTPLNAIMGMTHLCQADSSLSPAALDYLSHIRGAGRRLQGIINNILDISKIEAGMFELNIIPFDLRKVIREIVMAHRVGAAAKNISLDMSYQPPEAPDFFVGDPARLRQVINNLVDNAVKFTAQGEVSITCRVSAGAEGENAGISVSVHDSGIGMDEETKNKIFNPFTQADASITREFGGTGLGLTISERIIKIMGGSFTVTSTPGAGTDFTFTVSLAPEKQIRKNLPADSWQDALAGLSLEGRRILIAEDNRVNQIILQKFLHPTGAEIETANNGALAVEAIQTKPFDLIFMDMQMPVMDGLQATRIIREKFPAPALPIIAVTANALKEDKELAFQAGIDDYITKPIEPSHLITILSRWMGKGELN